MLISEEYRDLNKKLHSSKEHYGTTGKNFGAAILRLSQQIGSRDVLDYGCGKHTLAESLPFEIREYDPAIEGYDSIPKPADIVACTDVLEHIEPEAIDAVLDDLKRVTKKIGFFTVHTGVAKKTLADGRNAHLIQKPPTWWLPKIQERFDLLEFKYAVKGDGFMVIVKPK